MNKYAHEYVDARRSELTNAYTNEDDFVSGYYLSKKDIKEFREFVANEGVEISEEDWAISGEAMKVRLRAFIGRNLFESSTFYRIIGELNETLLEAIEILQDGRFEKARLANRTF